ncbi:MAG: hypothetical protein L0Y58_22030, partial [Verrucomicrobia subdivision 3 bacterium]|nr:hypothetical protein [Limisphaerales bacterium]
MKLLHFGLLCALSVSAGASDVKAPEGWQTGAPREEIRPSFSYNPRGGPSGKGSFLIESDAREGLQGFWHKPIPVTGGRYYRFSALRRCENVPGPRRSAVARVVWQSDFGQSVLTDEPLVSTVLPGFRRTAEPEYPADSATDPKGWTEVTGTYRAPAKATRAVVELYLQWAPRGKAEWSEISLVETSAPPARKARLAAVHYRPKGGESMADNCHQFAPLIEDAAKQRADLVVLPETLTYFGLGKSYAECAEPIPGPSADYFGSLAKKHDLYIVAGLIERDA